MSVNYWSGEEFPQYADKLRLFHGFLYSANNGSMDVESFIGSEYGQELGRRLHHRFDIEDEPLGEAALSYYESIGLKKEGFETEDFFTRWYIMTPLEAFTEEGKGKKYPLLFWHHGGGNPIESSECVANVCEVAGREKFIVVMAQNTNWKNVKRILDIVKEKYPVDEERVYCSGFSQGAQQSHSVFMHMPETFAGAAVSGVDLFRPYDNQEVNYTEEELERVRTCVVPVITFVGACEPSCFVPLNDWSPRRTPQVDIMHGFPDTRAHLNELRNQDDDPTRIVSPDGSARMAKGYAPAEGEDRHEWKVNMVNRRLELLGCDTLDVAKCIAFADHPEDEFHHIMGAYAPEERTELHYGYEHYVMDYFDHDGVNVMRYIAVENSPHWPQLIFGDEAWSFLKHFRRDSSTGKIVFEK